MSDLVGWAAFGLCMLGFVGLARKRSWGLIVFAASDLLWLAVGLMLWLPSLCVTSICLCIANVVAALIWENRI